MSKTTIRAFIVAGSLFAAAFLTPSKSHAAYTTFMCPSLSIVQLIVSSPTAQPRIAALCSSTNAGIQWFAFRTSTSADSAKMLLSTLTAAKAAGRPVLFGYESTDTAGASWGCDAATCRTIMKIEVN
jgi:hypothetical protein